jgi:hypothetical protein
MTIRIDYVSDWAERIRSRIYEQFKDSASWEKWVVFLGDMMQDLEDAAQSLFGLLDIDNGEGAQLDVIGRIVGQPRVIATDAGYRLLLRARILANKSTGGPEEIYKVFRAGYGQTIGLIITTEQVKTIVLRVLGQLTSLQASFGPEFLRVSKEAGARGLFMWQESTDAETFVTEGGDGQGFSTGAALTADVSLGSVTVPLDTGLVTTYFPVNGTIIIDPGLPTEESINYVNYVLSTNTTQNHSRGAWVQVSGSTYGGKLSGVRQA